MDAEDAEDVEQRNRVVYLLWVGVGISAHPRGCAPSAVRCFVGQLSAKGRGHSPPDSSQASESSDSLVPKLSSAHRERRSCVEDLVRSSTLGGPAGGPFGLRLAKAVLHEESYSRSCGEHVRSHGL